MPEPSTTAAENDDIVERETQAVASNEPVLDSLRDSSPEAASPPTPRGTTDQRAPEEQRHATEQDVRTLWLRRGDQIVVWLLMVALLVLLTLHWLRLSRWGSMPVELSGQQPREYLYSLDINSASWVEWAQLEGIGEKLARRIVADRDDLGPFRSIDDVGRVRGIGPKLLEKLRPFLQVETETVDRTPSHD